MHEQIDARSGVDPAVNGGEWNVLERDDLQYACSFELAEPRTCAASDASSNSEADCDCGRYGEPEYENPLCDGLPRYIDRRSRAMTR